MHGISALCGFPDCCIRCNSARFSQDCNGQSFKTITSFMSDLFSNGGRHPPVPGRNHRPDQRPVVRTRHRASQGTAPGSVPGQLARLIPGPASTSHGCLRPRRHTGHDGNRHRIRDRHHGGWTIAIRCDGTLIHVERDPQGGLTWQQYRLGT